jgi:hypothetical protein
MKGARHLQEMATVRASTETLASSYPTCPRAGLVDTYGVVYFSSNSELARHSIYTQR